jgi:hypothetical protein
MLAIAGWLALDDEFWIEWPDSLINIVATIFTIS